jgi:undecaprenyl-diphosphatase
MRPLQIPALRARTTIVLVAVCIAAFAALASDLHWHGPVTRADIPISVWFHLRAQPALIRLATAMSHMHSTLGLCLMALVAGAALVWCRQTVWLPLLALCVPGGLILNDLVKHLFQRARPSFDSSPLPLASYSFPSGHTAGATVWWGFALLVWFAWEKRPGPRAAGCAVALIMVVLTGLSRMVLGLHYLSDVLAAAAEGAAWVLLCVAACQGLAHRTRREPAR